MLLEEIYVRLHQQHHLLENLVPDGTVFEFLE